MRASILLPLRSLIVWFVALVSPIAYLFLLLLADRYHVAAPPEALVASILYALPFVALLICGLVVWRSSLAIGAKVAWSLLTLIGMSLQIFVVLVIVSAAIAYA